MQIPLFKPQTEWLPPEEFPDLSDHSEISIDLETKDPELTKMGSGAIIGKGEVVGIAVAVEGWCGYYPIAHGGGGNMDKTMVLKWFQDVLNTELLPTILSLLNAYDLPPEVLSFEMTEGHLVRDLSKAVKQLSIMREAGFKIAIDDFGTGYSSLSYLSRLPADVLKIDKSFILKLDQTVSDQNIVKSVVELGHQFGMEIVAEGIESQETLVLLDTLGEFSTPKPPPKSI